MVFREEFVWKFQDKPKMALLELALVKYPLRVLRNGFFKSDTIFYIKA